METRVWRYLLVFLTTACLAPGCAIYAAGHRSDKEKGRNAKPEIYPQMVRISYLQGDVRISRGDVGTQVSKSDWEVAVAGLPMETGYDLATGADGRAVIEFEDASTVYLAENSVLAFNDIHSTDGAPYTLLSLLTGTMTMRVEKPDGAQFKPDGATFIVDTPTVGVVAASGKTTYMRLSSYLDGFAISSRGESTLRLPDSTSLVTETSNNGTLYYVGGKQVAPEPDPAGAQRLASWDKWVDQRVTERAAAMASVMKQTGIDRPLPGLADLYEKGTFFKCEPYGTCWVAGDHPQARQESATASAPAPGGPLDPSLYGEGQYGAGWGMYPYQGFGFPCDPYWMFDASVDPMWSSYDWGLCSYGDWIGYNGGYAWVAPTTQGGGGQRYRFKLHHNPPVRWVRYGNKVGFVPLHPRDVKGKPPLNSGHGVFVMHGRRLEQVAYNSRESLRPLRGEPRQYMKPVYTRLARAAAPKPEVRNVALRGRTLAPGHAVMHAHLTFDHGSQSFLLARTVMAHGRTTNRTESFAGSGGMLQARAIGLDSRGNYNMERSFGGFKAGRFGPNGTIHGGWSGGYRGGGWSGLSNSGFSGGGGGGFGGGFSGGSSPVASGGPVSAAGGVHR